MELLITWVNLIYGGGVSRGLRRTRYLLGTIGLVPADGQRSAVVYMGFVSIYSGTVGVVLLEYAGEELRTPTATEMATDDFAGYVFRTGGLPDNRCRIICGDPDNLHRTGDVQVRAKGGRICHGV